MGHQNPTNTTAAADGAGRALVMSDAASSATCTAGGRLLANTILPLQSGLHKPNFAALPVPLGEVLLQLLPGDNVTLGPTVSAELAASLPPEGQLVAVSGPDTVRRETSRSTFRMGISPRAAFRSAVLWKPERAVPVRTARIVADRWKGEAWL